MQRRAGIRGGGKDGKEDKGAGTGTGRGAQKPPPPSFLPGWPVWAPQPLTAGVGETPSPCVQDVGPRAGPGAGRGGRGR